MFFGILLIAIGFAILLNTLGIMTGSFWGFFWAIFFVAIGLKIIIRNGKCPICGWHGFEGKMHNKMHAKMQGHCCDHNHGEEPEQ